METKRIMYNLISDGDLQGLKMCLAQHTKDEVELMVTAEDDHRRTPLTLACHRGHVDIVEYLVDECGADIEQCGWVEDDEFRVQEASPVCWAVAKGHLNIVQSLHSRGANMKGDASRPTFILACETENGLMGACFCGHCEVASYLIQMGLNVNLKDNTGDTALGFAVRGGSVSCMNLLLRNGAEVGNLWFGLVPLLMIRGTDDPHMVEFVINLPFSTRSGKIEGLESLGAKCVNIEIDQPGGQSDVDGEAADNELVIDSIACGHRTTLVDMEQLGNEDEEMRVDALLIRKPIGDCRMPVGTCFVSCLGSGLEECCYSLWLFAVEILKKSAVSLRRLTDTCLLRIGEMLDVLVVRRKRVEFEVIMAVFVVAVREFESEMCRTTSDCRFEELTTTLMFRIFRVLPTWSSTQAQLFHQVVHKFVGLNPRNALGWTVLHHACCGNAFPLMFEVVKSLLEHGADPGAIDDHRDSPLHLVAKSRPVRRDLIRLLLSYGAHFDARNSDGKCFNDLLPEDERFNPLDYVTLKCLAAASVVKNSIPYESHVPRKLADFIKLHISH